MTIAYSIQTEPAREPLTLQEAKDHLRVTADDEHAYLLALIKAARVYAEGYTHRAFITQTWELRRDTFPYEFHLPLGPLQSVSSVKYIDNNGTEQTVASTVYTVDTVSDPGRVHLSYSKTWPSHRFIQHAVRVTFVCGYGDYGTNVPEPLRQGMLLLISAWYENREPVIVGTNTMMMPAPITVEALLGPYRIATP